MKFNDNLCLDENGNSIVIEVNDTRGVDYVELTYDMIRVSGISPSMLYQLVHKGELTLGETKFIRMTEDWCD